MKKIPIALLALSLFIITAPVYAADISATTGISANLQLNSIGEKNDVGVKTETNQSASVKRTDRGSQEIDQRISALNTLLTRLNAMKHIDDTTKASITATTQSQIQVLTNLKAKIAADTDAATLKSDVSSITGSYRIFALIIPQGAIAANVDSIKVVTNLMTAFETKVSARISEAKTAGKDTSSLDSAYTDYTAKVADANVQAQAALTLTASLKPDNGDQTIAASNKAALSQAHSKLQAARSDLKAARSDAGTMVKELKSLNVSAKATTSTQITTQ